MLPMTREEERRLVARFGRGPSLSRGLYLTKSDCERRREEMLGFPFPDPRKCTSGPSWLRREVLYGAAGGLLGAILGQVFIWLVCR